MQSLASKDFGSDALIRRYFSSAQCFTTTLTNQVDDNRMTGSLLALGVLNTTSSGERGHQIETSRIHFPKPRAGETL
jgi:hypothetical protein